MKIYCFGNPLVKGDRLPLLIINDLRKDFRDIDFIEASSTDEIEDEEETINIIDTVKGIDKVSIIDDISYICDNKNCSLHDFDLGMTLKIMAKMNKNLKIRVIGIPSNYKKKDAIKEVKKIIKDAFFQNNQ
jgi:hypothetical protein